MEKEDLNRQLEALQEELDELQEFQELHEKIRIVQQEIKEHKAAERERKLEPYKKAVNDIGKSAKRFIDFILPPPKPKKGNSKVVKQEHDPFHIDTGM